MEKESVINRLELIAAKARQLAIDLRANKFWPGELEAGIHEISEQANRAAQEASRK